MAGDKQVSLQQVSSHQWEAWDRYVEQHPHGSPYHLSAWARAVEQAYGHRCHYLAAFDGERIVGVLPLVAMKIPVLGAQLCSQPFCDLGGVLADSPEIAEALLAEADTLRTQVGGKAIALRHSAEPSEAEPEPGVKVRMLLPLGAPADEVFNRFKSKLRSQVRKAGKNGVSFVEGTTAAHRAGFYRVMQVNMHQLGSPVHSSRWFESVLDFYGDHARLGIVEFEGQVVGGAIILMCGGTVTVPWASTLPEYNRLSPNMLLYWGLLAWAADGGYERFDFGRSTVGEGTYKFKKQWGAEPVPLRWQTLSADGLADVDSSPSEGGGLRDKVAEAWRKLPHGLVNVLGPMLRRYISL